MEHNQYGNGNPPYSLYQDGEDKWGLVDKDGLKLPAVFRRYDVNFYNEIGNEALYFDEQEGFGLIAWYDPCEIWYNFIWDNPDYPQAYNRFFGLYKKDAPLEEYIETIKETLASQAHWYLDLLADFDRLEKGGDYDDEAILDSWLEQYPALTDFRFTTDLLVPAMESEKLSDFAKSALWVTKVWLDDDITYNRKGNEE